MEMLTEPEC